jgi:uncharacterized protein (DUF2267 family)
MINGKVAVGIDEVTAFLEAIVRYIRTLDPCTGQPIEGNEEAKRQVALCKGILGILPLERDIPSNISRIEKILAYLDSRLSNEISLHALLRKAHQEIASYSQGSAREHTPNSTPHQDPEREKGDFALSTKEVLKGNYADFHEIFEDAKEAVINQLRDEISPEILIERLNQMQKRIDEEYTGGMEGLKIYLDAKHSGLLLETRGGQAEKQRDFLFRMAKTFLMASLCNKFYDLYERISHRTREDGYSFVFRMAKKYTDIKSDNSKARITPYVSWDGNIQLRSEENPG